MALPNSNAEAFIVSISPFTVTLPPNCDVLSVATVIFSVEVQPVEESHVNFLSLLLFNIKPAPLI